jgi:hypothetical protein
MDGKIEIPLACCKDMHVHGYSSGLSKDTLVLSTSMLFRGPTL